MAAPTALKRRELQGLRLKAALPPRRAATAIAKDLQQSQAPIPNLPSSTYLLHARHPTTLTSFHAQHCADKHRGRPSRSATCGSSSADRPHRTTAPLLPNDDSVPATARHWEHCSCPDGSRVQRLGGLPIRKVVRAGVGEVGAAFAVVRVNNACCRTKCEVAGVLLSA